jgi:hypothetical protein
MNEMLAATLSTFAAPEGALFAEGGPAAKKYKTPRAWIGWGVAPILE